MATHTLRGRVTEDGRLEVTLPAGLGPCEATIDIRPDERSAARGNAQQLLAVLADLDAEGWKGTGRTKAEMDADIEAARGGEYPIGDTRRFAARLRRWEAEGWTGSGRSSKEIEDGIREQRDSWGDD